MTLEETEERQRPGLPMRAAAYLTVPEAAELARCNPRTIRRAVEAGTLAAFRPARRILLREVDVVAWIESRPVRAPERARPAPVRRPRAAPGSPGSVQALREMERHLSPKEGE